MNRKQAKAMIYQMIEQPHLYPKPIVFYKVGAAYMYSPEDSFHLVQPKYKVKIKGPIEPDEILFGDMPHILKDEPKWYIL